MIILFCENCGCEINNGEKFCPACGTKTDQFNYENVNVFTDSDNANAGQNYSEPKTKNVMLPIIISMSIILIALAVVLTLFLTGIIEKPGSDDDETSHSTLDYSTTSKYFKKSDSTEENATQTTQSYTEYTTTQPYTEYTTAQQSAVNDYPSQTTYKIATKKDNLNVRVKPSTSSKALISIPNNTTVSVSDVKYDADGKAWGYVKYKNKTGWICLTGFTVHIQ